MAKGKRKKKKFSHDNCESSSQKTYSDGTITNHEEIPDITGCTCLSKTRKGKLLLLCCARVEGCPIHTTSKGSSVKKERKPKTPEDESSKQLSLARRFGRWLIKKVTRRHKKEHISDPIESTAATANTYDQSMLQTPCQYASDDELKTEYSTDTVYWRQPGGLPSTFQTLPEPVQGNVMSLKEMCKLALEYRNNRKTHRQMEVKLEEGKRKDDNYIVSNECGTEPGICDTFPAYIEVMSLRAMCKLALKYGIDRTTREFNRIEETVMPEVDNHESDYGTSTTQPENYDTPLKQVHDIVLPLREWCKAAIIYQNNDRTKEINEKHKEKESIPELHNLKYDIRPVINEYDTDSESCNTIPEEVQESVMCLREICKLALKYPNGSYTHELNGISEEKTIQPKVDNPKSVNEIITTGQNNHIVMPLQELCNAAIQYQNSGKNYEIDNPKCGKIQVIRDCHTDSEKCDIVSEEVMESVMSLKEMSKIVLKYSFDGKAHEVNGEGEKKSVEPELDNPESIKTIRLKPKHYDTPLKEIHNLVMPLRELCKAAFMFQNNDKTIAIFDTEQQKATKPGFDKTEYDKMQIINEYDTASDNFNRATKEAPEALKSHREIGKLAQKYPTEVYTPELTGINEEKTVEPGEEIPETINSIIRAKSDNHGTPLEQVLDEIMPPRELCRSVFMLKNNGKSNELNETEQRKATKPEIDNPNYDKMKVIKEYDSETGSCNTTPEAVLESVMSLRKVCRLALKYPIDENTQESKQIYMEGTPEPGKDNPKIETNARLTKRVNSDTPLKKAHDEVMPLQELCIYQNNARPEMAELQTNKSTKLEFDNSVYDIMEVLEDNDTASKTCERDPKEVPEQVKALKEVCQGVVSYKIHSETKIITEIKQDKTTAKPEQDNLDYDGETVKSLMELCKAAIRKAETGKLNGNEDIETVNEYALMCRGKPANYDANIVMSAQVMCSVPIDIEQAEAAIIYRQDIYQPKLDNLDKHLEPASSLLKSLKDLCLEKIGDTDDVRTMSAEKVACYNERSDTTEKGYKADAEINTDVNSCQETKLTAVCADVMNNTDYEKLLTSDAEVDLTKRTEICLTAFRDVTKIQECLIAIRDVNDIQGFKSIYDDTRINMVKDMEYDVTQTESKTAETELDRVKCLKNKINHLKDIYRTAITNAYNGKLVENEANETLDRLEDKPSSYDVNIAVPVKKICLVPINTEQAEVDKRYQEVSYSPEPTDFDKHIEPTNPSLKSLKDLSSETIRDTDDARIVSTNIEHDNTNEKEAKTNNGINTDSVTYQEKTLTAVCAEVLNNADYENLLTSDTEIDLTSRSKICLTAIRDVDKIKKCLIAIKDANNVQAFKSTNDETTLNTVIDTENVVNQTESKTAETELDKIKCLNKKIRALKDLYKAAITNADNGKSAENEVNKTLNDAAFRFSGKPTKYGADTAVHLPKISSIPISVEQAETEKIYQKNLHLPDLTESDKHPGPASSSLKSLKDMCLERIGDIEEEKIILTNIEHDNTYKKEYKTKDYINTDSVAYHEKALLALCVDVMNNKEYEKLLTSNVVPDLTKRIEVCLTAFKEATKIQECLIAIRDTNKIQGSKSRNDDTSANMESGTEYNVRQTHSTTAELELDNVKCLYNKMKYLHYLYKATISSVSKGKSVEKEVSDTPNDNAESAESHLSIYDASMKLSAQELCSEVVNTKQAIAEIILQQNRYQPESTDFDKHLEPASSSPKSLKNLSLEKIGDTNDDRIMSNFAGEKFVFNEQGDTMETEVETYTCIDTNDVICREKTMTAVCADVMNNTDYEELLTNDAEVDLTKQTEICLTAFGDVNKIQECLIAVKNANNIQSLESRNDDTTISMVSNTEFDVSQTKSKTAEAELDKVKCLRNKIKYLKDLYKAAITNSNDGKSVENEAIETPNDAAQHCEGKPTTSYDVEIVVPMQDIALLEGKTGQAEADKIFQKDLYSTESTDFDKHFEPASSSLKSLKDLCLKVIEDRYKPSYTKPQSDDINEAKISKENDHQYMSAEGCNAELFLLVEFPLQFMDDTCTVRRFKLGKNQRNEVITHYEIDYAIDLNKPIPGSGVDIVDERKDKPDTRMYEHIHQKTTEKRTKMKKRNRISQLLSLTGANGGLAANAQSNRRTNQEIGTGAKPKRRENSNKNMLPDDLENMKTGSQVELTQEPEVPLEPQAEQDQAATPCTDPIDDHETRHRIAHRRRKRKQKKAKWY